MDWFQNYVYLGMEDIRYQSFKFVCIRRGYLLFFADTPKISHSMVDTDAYLLVFKFAFRHTIPNITKFDNVICCVGVERPLSIALATVSLGTHTSRNGPT